MKRPFFRSAVCLLGVCASLLVACTDEGLAAPPSASATGTALTTLTKTDAGKTFKFESGAMFRIELAGNRTTGYSWQVSQSGDSVAVEKSTYTPDDHAPGIVGSGGKETFPCKAIKKGLTTIRLVERQPWKGGGVGEKIEFKIVVR